MTLAERFGENLRRCRKAAAQSQEETAFRASLHRTHVGMMERGERLPRIDTVIKLASALEVDPGELLDGIDWQPGTVTVVPGRFE